MSPARALGYRQRVFYLAWFSATLLAILPYLSSFLNNGSAAEIQQATLQSPLNIPMILILLGLPFAPSMSNVWAGLGGIGAILLCSSGGVLLWRIGQKSVWREVAPSLMLLAYGAGGAWQVSLFRERPYPWYSYLGMTFWTGLLGLVFVLWTNRTNFRNHNLSLIRRRRWPLVEAWCLIAVGAVTLLYLATNQTYADKSIFLQTRSPASASCLRHYLTAPTYCETTLFVWPTYRIWHLPDLVNVLQRHHLSVFAPIRNGRYKGTLSSIA